MRSFNDINSLKKYLQEDRESVSLCPVRFINVETMKMWVEVKKILLPMVGNFVYLSSFCEEEDTTPNIRRMKSKLKSTSVSVCVTPLSEYLRIRTEIAEQSIADLLTMEYENNNNGRLRVYFLMYRMKGILLALPEKDPRKKDCIIFLNTDEETDYSLTIIQQELNIKVKGNEINGFKQYLEYWEENPDKPLILYTNNAIYFNNNTFFDDVKVIVTSFDLMKFHYKIPLEISYKYGTDEYWNRLAKTVVKENDFYAACCAEFNIRQYDKEIFDNWAKYDDYKKWLLWLWAKLQSGSEYVVLCAKEGKSSGNFVENIWEHIIPVINHVNYKQKYEERKRTIISMQLQAPLSFWNKIESFLPKDALKCLTNATDNEKQYIFKILQGIPFSKRKEVIDTLYIVFPELAYYISNSQVQAFSILSDEQISYLEEYRWLKATNNLTSEFVEKVKNIALQKGENVYSMTSRNQMISNIYNEADTAILFVDGLGIEYIDFLAYLLSDIDTSKYSVTFSASYCNLPSTTEANKDFLNNRRVIREILTLDEYKHGNNKYPNNVMEELNLISEYRDIILGAFNDEISKIVLATDHGTSRLAVYVRETEFDNKLPAKGHIIYKYGRYCEGNDMAAELPTAIEYGNKLIFADYSRFEQKGSPIDEIHGGASLEEWIVPIITVECIDTNKATMHVKILLKTPVVKIDTFTKMITVKFEISGKSEKRNISVTIHGKKIVCSYVNNVYEFKYRPLADETEVVAKVMESAILGEISFKIIHGITGSKRFDI